jgi:putative heme iron utilization protein
MTLEGIGPQLAAIQKDLTTVKDDLSGLKRDVSGLKQDVSGLKQDLASTRKDLGGQMLSVLDRVDGLANNMKVEFEQTRGVLRFGLDAREALRETMEARFAEADQKHDQQIALLKDVLRAER